MHTLPPDAVAIVLTATLAGRGTPCTIIRAVNRAFRSHHDRWWAGVCTHGDWDALVQACVARITRGPTTPDPEVFVRKYLELAIRSSMVMAAAAMRGWHAPLESTCRWEAQNVK